MSYVGPSPFQTSLLKTAIATVKSGINAVETNILFDEGTQRTFISMSFASKLKLQPSTKETINLAAFGALTPIDHSGNYVTANTIFNLGPP